MSYRGHDPQGEVRVAAGGQYRVKLDDQLLRDVAALIGAGRVTTRMATPAPPVEPEIEEMEESEMETEPVWSEA